MKYKIVSYPRFEKNLSEIKLSEKAQQRLVQAVECLEEHGHLCGQFKDHKLSYQRKLNKRYNSKVLYDFHLEGNLVILYYTDEASKIVYLVNIGSHKKTVLRESFTQDSPTRIKLFE